MEGFSNGESHKSFWRRIWRLHLPNKMKSFAWRVCHNIIPMKANLKRRKLIKESLCEACGLEEEISGHAFWDCEHAREVWHLLGITFKTQRVLYREFVDLIWYLMFVQHVGDVVLEMVFMISWCMWYNRNAIRHGSSCQSA